MSDKNGREIIHKNGCVGVLLPLVFAHPFDYRVADGQEVRAGDYVRVPFGRKSLWGVVWGKAEGSVEEKKIKSIETIAAHLPPMSDTMRAFLDWVAWYTLAPKGMVLKMALSSPDALEPPAVETRYILAEGSHGRGQKTEQETVKIKLTPARQRIIAYLSDGVARTAKEITQSAKVTAIVVREYIKAGGLSVSSSRVARAGSHAALMHKDIPILSSDQQAAAQLLEAKLDNGFSVSLLDGVTGSGKTEVYFDAIEKCLAAGKQALVLLPEIALSVQWLSRFEKRFGFAPDTWHSGVTPAKKRGLWQRVSNGDSQMVVGARSALFLPFKNLSLIVVDEEHDASYKQEEGVIYHARDMAVARAHREEIPIVLVSATPSLESEYNVEHGRYARLHLPARHAGASLPTVRLIDMRKEKTESGNWISDPLRSALLAAAAQKQQAMLFMNRRGYAPLLLCRACGHRFQCPHCTSWLVLHKKRGKLLCHHCGHEAFVPKQCPDCKAEESLILYGPGVERIAEEVRLLLPEARIEVMTSDHIDTPAKMDALIHAMIAGEIDILIGTQMIAKGHHFAGLALVGVIDADMGLAGGDLRAGERTYQLLHQLSGRAGRETTPGEVWLQTYMPEHPVMQALKAGDRDQFMALEARMRQEALMPPYGKLAAVIIEGKNETEVAGFARSLMKHSSHALVAGDAPLLLGPVPAPISLLRGKYRYRILIKAARSFSLQPFLAGWLGAEKMPASLKLKVDIDPYSFV